LNCRLPSVDFQLSSRIHDMIVVCSTRSHDWGRSNLDRNFLSRDEIPNRG
jgi:hypothetical protein